MLRSWLITVGTAALLSAVPSAVAQQQIETIELLPGAQHIRTLTEVFDSVSVGNPEVVDVLPKSDRVLAIVGKKAGSADIIAFREARPILKISVSVGEPRILGKVYTHTQKGVENYIAYECNPVCVRIKDDFAIAPSQDAGSNITVVVPPRGQQNR